MTKPTESLTGPVAAVNRARSLAAGALNATQATLLLVGVPAVVLMFVGSLWEGGDMDEKHRIVAWSMLAALGNLVGTVLFGLLAVASFRVKPGQRPLALSCAGLLCLLAAGWVWTLGGHLLADPTLLGLWALLTLPGLAGCALIVASDAPVSD